MVFKRTYFCFSKAAACSVFGLDCLDSLDCLVITADVSSVLLSNGELGLFSTASRVATAMNKDVAIPTRTFISIDKGIIVTAFVPFICCVVVE